MNFRLTTQTLVFAIAVVAFAATQVDAVKHSTGFSAVISGRGYGDAYDDLETPEHVTVEKTYSDSGLPHNYIYTGLPVCTATNGVASTNILGDGRALCWIFGHGDTEVKKAR